MESKQNTWSGLEREVALCCDMQWVDQFGLQGEVKETVESSGPAHDPSKFSSGLAC